MIWLTWRQLRTQAVVVYAALCALAILLAITGPDLLALHRTVGSGDFLDQISSANGRLYAAGIVAVLAVPAVIGVFWGAPLVTRELEAGTHRLVWNQSITRTRWLATKMGLTGAAALAATGLLSLAVTWWCLPIDRALNDGYRTNGILEIPRLFPVIFDARGIVPVGYAAFALALGITAGAVLRRTVPAMSLTLAVFVVVQLAVPAWVRPHLIEPDQVTTAITAQNLAGLRAAGPDMPIQEVVVRIDAPGAWILSNQTVDATGKVVRSLPVWTGDCAVPPGRAPTATQQACFTRLAQEGYQQRVTYHPASRYWPLQWAETGLYVALSLLLTGLCFWWVRRRLS